MESVINIIDPSYTSSQNSVNINDLDIDNYIEKSTVSKLEFDINGDGKNELIRLCHGLTWGIYTLLFVVQYEDESLLTNLFSLKYGEYSLEILDGELQIVEASDKGAIYHKVQLVNGEIELSGFEYCEKIEVDNN